MTSPDPQTGRFPEQNALGFYDREITVHSEADRPNSVTLKDDFVVRDPVTDKVVWQYTVYPKVDPATARHLDAQYSADIIAFPRNVEKRSYNLRINYIEGVPLRYLKEDVVEGVPVYVFGYKGRAEYTESYLETPDYPGVPVAADQEIKCADDQFSVVIWVEPRTGETLKLAERCDAGDYIYNVSTGSPISPVLRWGAETAGKDVLRRAEWVRQERLELIALDYAPLALAGCGIALAGAGLFRRRAPS